jgi:hypothetical protein
MAFGDLARQDDYGVDPLTGVPFAPSPEAQSKFGRIADAVIGGLRNWVETPGRALRGEATPEDAYQWGPATAFGMIAGSKLPGGAVGSGMARLTPPAPGANRVVRYPEGLPVVSEEPFHGFTSTRTGAKPTTEMTSQIKAAPAFERPLVSPADLQGKEIIFTQGDRTRAGGQLTKVGNTKLTRPVPLEGGPDFPFAQSGLGWANAPAHSTQMLDLGKSVAERGRDPVLMYLAMGKGSMDSAKQMAIPAVDLARQSGLSNKVVTELNTRMRGVDPEFPGWKSAKLDDWLRSTSGTNRASLVENLDSGWARAGGAPDLGELRYALTDPRLRTTPTGSVGLTVSKLDPSSGIVPSRHSTYPTAVAGSSAGTMGGSVPWHVAAPDVHRWLLRRGPPVKFAERPAFFQERKPTDPTFPRTQLADQQWVDSVSEWIRKNPSMWAAGGAVPLGGLAAQDNYRQ